MPYIAPTLTKLIKQGEQDIESRLEGSQPRLPFSVERAVNFSTAALVKDLHDRLDHLSRQIVPTLESEDDTIISAANRRGIPRKPSQKASGPAQFNGTEGTEMPSGTRMQRGDGVVYVTTSSAIVSGGVCHHL